MKKIISLMILLLMIATVSARTEEKSFTTDINVTLKYNGTQCRYDIESENNDFSDYTSSSETRKKTYTIKIYRDVVVEELSNLENITKVMGKLADVSLQLATYGNDSKTYQEKYNEKNEAWARVCENYEDCKEDRDRYKNDSIKLTAYQTDLTNCKTTKNQCVNTDLPTCTEDLEDQEASTQTGWLVGGLIGAVGMFLFIKGKEYLPAEKGSFQ